MATATRSEYVGSTSTLSKAFSHLYFALSGAYGPVFCGLEIDDRKSRCGIWQFVECFCLGSRLYLALG